MLSIFRSQPTITENKLPEDLFFHKLRQYTIQERKAESARILNKYPDRIPIIVDRGDKTTPSIDKHKYLVPLDCTLAQFQTIIRSKIKLASSDALFFFVGNSNTLTRPTELLSQLYKTHKDEDGYLYVTYVQESTFG